MRIVGKRKGAVLIVVLGVLAVLALLAVSFATLQATEKQVARNYLDTVRAKMLAESGVSEAEARLREYFPFQYFNLVNPSAPQPWKWWGIDSPPWETREPNPLDPLEKTTNPSFAIENEPIQNPLDSNVAPKLIMIEGQNVGLSGYYGTGSYDSAHGDNYSLKVSDLSGRLYVNDGLDGGNNGSVSQNMRRILNVLGAVIQSPLLGDKIIGARPASGYRSMQDLLKALNYDENLFKRVKPHVTVYAWVDPNCVNPVPLSVATFNTNLYPVKYYRGNPQIFRYQHSLDAAGNDFMSGIGGPLGGFQLIGTPGGGSPSSNTPNPVTCVYGMDQLNPNWIEIVKRAPVNINSASREVLVALLTDVQGWFLADRRRNNPRWKGDLYLSFKQTESWSPAGVEGDEIGYLMSTIPVVGPGGTATTGISAFQIADEIIACRNRQASKFGGNYAQMAFGGPFKTMIQLYAFIDNLVKVGLIDDNRPLHFDFEQEVSDPTGFGALVTSIEQRKNAAKAAADALKANFNPNCHLNCLNPDENLYLRVDKTCLMTMSTEFTFMPTGLFEVESLGRVLRPKQATVKDSYLGDNELMAQAKVVATYKLYDLYRETNFKQFYAGTLPGRTGISETNNNMSLEIGPEVDNGKFVNNLGDTSSPTGGPDNEWDGYIALPTVGGTGHSAPTHVKNTMTTTLSLPPTAQFGSIAHCHFQYDFDCHHHLLDAHEIASHDAPDEKVWNYPSIDPASGGPLGWRRPYGPASGPLGLPPPGGIPNHRAAKSFRQVLNSATGTQSAPALAPFVPTDLRIDGAYSERHAGPAYYGFKNGMGLWTTMATGPKSTGMIQMWVKPNYYPDLTGKLRYMWDFSRSHGIGNGYTCGASVQNWPWTIGFYPAHYMVTTEESNSPRYWSNNVGQFLPASLLFGSKQWHDDTGGGLNDQHCFGNITTSLNHLDHVSVNPACPSKPSPLQGHKWINLSVQWFMNGWDSNQTTSKFFVNGTQSYVPYTFTTMTGGWAAGQDHFWHWDHHDGGDSNQMRLGSCSHIGNDAARISPVPGAYRGNYSGDHTVDEFYCWNSPSDSNPLTLWLRGRYYVPTDMNYGEGLFVSEAISFLATTPRTLAPPTSLPTPGGTGSTTGGSLPTVPTQIRVLGLAWTWYGEGIDIYSDTMANKVHQTLWDYSGAATGGWGAYPDSTGPATYGRPSTAPGMGVPYTDLKPQVLLGIRDGGMNYGPYPNDGFSAVRAPDNTIPVIQDPMNVKWFAQFKVTMGNISSVLLATPVLDDVTIYWDDSRSHLLSYVYDNRVY